LVKGIAPPPKQKVSSDRPKCTNIDECQALAEQKEREAREGAAANALPVFTTAVGTRYRDIQEGTGRTAKDGDDVTLYYKVLKLGKRSYDGLSGEGTVVFSRGYGLEDDEKEARTKSFMTTLGGFNNIAALNDAVVGMKEAGIRRFAVFPDKGWRKPGRACDGGPGGAGTGGDLKTDYVVVPTATMVAEESCLDSTKQPYPSTYGQQRRMAQRFDQSLIMEVELVKVAPGGSTMM
jgi:FKBP-type peptidyl-prolyl cis-trans isomerase